MIELLTSLRGITVEFERDALFNGRRVRMTANIGSACCSNERIYTNGPADAWLGVKELTHQFEQLLKYTADTLAKGKP